MTTAHLPEHAEIPPPALQEVSPGVYAYIQLDGSWGLNNTAFFAAGDGVIAVDACFTEARTRALIGAIRSVSDQPVRALVNTHHHGDHTYGNWLFPGAAIVGHERCREETIAAGVQPVDRFGPALCDLGADWAKASIATAQEHFASELVRREIAAALHALPPAPDGVPRLVLACPEAERHDLGLAALALLLRQAGMQAIFLGADLPPQDLDAAVADILPDAVCLAVTSASGAAALVRVSRTLVTRRHLRVFVGGPALPHAGLEPVGVLLPASLAAAARLIVQQVSP